MPDAIIELDLSTPWEPPEPPHSPRRRAHRRWFALIAVALLTAGVLVAAAPRRGSGPAFTVDYQVSSINAGGGRLVFTRLRPSGAESQGGGSQIEALSLHDGTQLWSVPAGPDQHLAIVTDRVVGMTTEFANRTGQSGTLTVLDAATGERLWQRSQVRTLGRAGGRFVVEDLTGVVDDQPNLVFSSSSNGAADIPVNPPAAQRDQRYLALDEQTGSTVWKVEVPKGSLGTGIWSDYYSLGGMTELSSTGLLRIRDLGTGAVTATYQLDWSGTISSYTTGTSFPGAAPAVRDQVVIYKAGDRGADVYDRGSGRLLWHWQDRSLYGWLSSCAPELYCVQDRDGMGALDAHNGRPVWSVQRYNSILHLKTDVILLTRWDETDPLTASGVAAVNVRTGQVLRALDNWSVVQGPLNRAIVWKPLDNRTAVLGVVDPRTSQVTVFDKAENWNGRPECVQSDDHLACAVADRLSVWKLP